jgi:hypothetical protein
MVNSAIIWLVGEEIGPVFESRISYKQFEKSVKRHARYIHESEAEEFLGSVAATTDSRVRILARGELFYRAQRGAREDPAWQEQFGFRYALPFPMERMVPRRNLADEGRVNPKGIPCLYLATDEKTAIAEVRPWVGALVSVAPFTLVRECRLVDCSDVPPLSRLFTKEQREHAVWQDIAYAFSTPVEDRGANTADYAPTQILAEMFRKRGYDGIAYASKLGKGKNIALFDLDLATPGTVKYDITNVQYESSLYEESYAADLVIIRQTEDEEAEEEDEQAEDEKSAD